MRASTFARLGVVIYCLAAFGFVVEFIGEVTGVWLFGFGWVVHEVTELATLLGFVVGGVFIWQSQAMLRRRNDEVESVLRVARGEFQAMLQAQFIRWDLSDAETDVALLTVKGLSVAEIAAARNTTEGTVKSQSNAIYRKAGVKTRTQLVSAIIDELLVDDGVST